MCAVQPVIACCAPSRRRNAACSVSFSNGMEGSMTPLPEDPAARAWRAEMRLAYELQRVGVIGRRPPFRAELLASSSHFAVIMAGARWGRRK